MGKLKERQYLVGGELMAMRVEVPEYEMHEEVWVDPACTALVVVDLRTTARSEAPRCRADPPGPPERTRASSQT